MDTSEAYAPPKSAVIDAAVEAPKIPLQPGHAGRVPQGRWVERRL